ncbi:MAG: hypothetical protein R6V61_01070 [Wenzhouxiangellaceae bacterium]
MTENLEVHYLYRDGANNKRCQTVVLANPDGITPGAPEQAIRTRFSELQVWPDILHFQPEKLGWQTAYFPGHDLNREDLNVHEIDEITLAEAPATVSSQTAAQLIRNR